MNLYLCVLCIVLAPCLRVFGFGVEPTHKLNLNGWTFLPGGFFFPSFRPGPVKNEIFEKDLPVVGKLPQELNGAYMWVIIMRVEAYYKVCYLHIDVFVCYTKQAWSYCTYVQTDGKRPFLWPLTCTCRRNGSNPYFDPYASYHWFEGSGVREVVDEQLSHDSCQQLSHNTAVNALCTTCIHHSVQARLFMLQATVQREFARLDTFKIFMALFRDCLLTCRWCMLCVSRMAMRRTAIGLYRPASWSRRKKLVSQFLLRLLTKRDNVGSSLRCWSCSRCV